MAKTRSTGDVVFDVESVGTPLDQLDEAQRAHWLKPLEWEADEARRQKRLEALVRGLNFTPLTAQTAAIAVLNVDTGRGKVFYQADEREPWRSEDGQVEFVPGDERACLERFWAVIPAYRRFVTFNGRGFDCPFLLIRSAILGIKPTRNLMPRRYDKNHIDLMDQLGFHGALAHRFPLDFYCKAFGIDSPKSQGLSSEDVNALFAQGARRQIAELCLSDVIATAELYRRWRAYLSFEV